MEVQTFKAGSMQEALRLVKTTLGPDASVLRTREVQGGVLRRIAGRTYIEITATRDFVPARSQTRRAPVVERSRLRPTDAHGVDLDMMQTSCDPKIRAGTGEPRFAEIGPTPNSTALERDEDATSPVCGIALPLVAVSGGKSGVGSSTIALRLATALQRGGCRSLLVEADLARSGVVEPGDNNYSISDCLSGKRTLAEVCRPDPDGILVVPGVRAPREMADDTAVEQQQLLEELQRPIPQTDVIVIDLGSSRDSFVRRLWQAASMVVVVATDDAECVTDTYAAIKLLHAGDTSIPIYTLLNFACQHGSSDAVHDRIGHTCKRFLGLRTSTLGSIPRFDEPTGEMMDEAVGQIAGVLAAELGLAAHQPRAMAA